MLTNSIGKKALILMVQILSKRLNKLKDKIKVIVKKDIKEVNKFVKSPSIDGRPKTTFIS